jgi:hypothetical protein
MIYNQRALQISAGQEWLGNAELCPQKSTGIDGVTILEFPLLGQIKPELPP